MVLDHDGLHLMSGFVKDHLIVDMNISNINSFVLLCNFRKSQFLNEYYSILDFKGSTKRIKILCFGISFTQNRLLYKIYAELIKALLPYELCFKRFLFFIEFPLIDSFEFQFYVFFLAHIFYEYVYIQLLKQPLNKLNITKSARSNDFMDINLWQ